MLRQERTFASYWFLIVPLLLTQRKALRRDLSSLKAAIEAQEITSNERAAANDDTQRVAPYKVHWTIPRGARTCCWIGRRRACLDCSGPM